MIDPTPELDSHHFLLAAQIERENRREQRRRAKSEALAALHQARDAFRRHADNLATADHDGDRLERLADRLTDWSCELQHDLDRLDAARDETLYRGRVLTRQQAPMDAAALTEALAESLAERFLSSHAGAVLLAAVRFAWA